MLGAEGLLGHRPHGLGGLVLRKANSNSFLEHWRRALCQNGSESLPAHLQGKHKPPHIQSPNRSLHSPPHPLILHPVGTRPRVRAQTAHLQLNCVVGAFGDWAYIFRAED